MPRNGSGGYNLPQASFVAGTVISSAAVNSDFNDIATALTGSLPRDGQAGMTGQFKASDGGLASPSISFANEINTGFFRPGTGQLAAVIGGTQVGVFTSTGYSGLITNAGILPAGIIVDHAGNPAPALWLLCFGQ